LTEVKRYVVVVTAQCAVVSLWTGFPS